MGSQLGNLEWWRTMARHRLPKVAFDFIDGGAEEEVTLSRNRTAFNDLSLIPRVLRGIGEVSADVELFGRRLRLPVLIAPTGVGRIAGPEGEIGYAKGASAAGTISVMSCLGSLPAEAVARSVPEPQWFQLYLARDRAVTLQFVERAKQLGFSVLVVTADTPVAGNRERDTRNGLRVPLKITPKMMFGAALRPRWVWHYLTGGPIAAHVQDEYGADAAGSLKELKTLADYTRAMLNPNQSWDDMRWLRTVWDGPLLVKGVMCSEDAELALEAGCDGVIVSNHGGRQLDGVPAAIEALPEVVEAVGARVPVLIDGGIRRGTDILKALCLGAKACLVGRPAVFGLAAGGATGVTRVLKQLQAEILRGLQLVGASSVAELTSEFVRRRPGSGWERMPSAQARTMLGG